MRLFEKMGRKSFFVIGLILGVLLTVVSRHLMIQLHSSIYFNIPGSISYDIEGTDIRLRVSRSVIRISIGSEEDVAEIDFDDYEVEYGPFTALRGEVVIVGLKHLSEVRRKIVQFGITQGQDGLIISPVQDIFTELPCEERMLLKELMALSEDGRRLLIGVREYKHSDKRPFKKLVSMAYHYDIQEKTFTSLHP